ncbi:2,3-bisphosphoglycerate-independent phosphoglycerate mutase [Candidatus Peregrinibacteria bacterium]|nr:2,3-bisphosphoglycerate-independent phosphoglycerate mutase [Candidatus Peregrinibacteria bacterium]
MSKKVLLTILDGFGEGPSGAGNAITLANTPNIDKLRSKYPYGKLKCTGEAVGLTEGTMGGSEVGHFTIGAGRIVPQFLLDINNSIKDGSFFQKKPLVDVFKYVKESGKSLHLMGMISNKGVHSHIDHLITLLDWAAKEKLEKVFIHCITDGRDVEERSASRYLKLIELKINETGVGKIATIVGRYYSMDRDTNWNRTEKAYRLMTAGEGENFSDYSSAIDYYYKSDADLSDYYLPPILLDESGLIKEGDGVIFFNYRTDRTRQITSAFVDPDFDKFERTIGEVKFVCMGPYSENAPIVFDVPEVKNNLANWLAENGKTQLRCAETEKYAHVTFFFNSQVEHPVKGEERILVHSPKVPSYAEKPEMSAPEVTNKVIAALAVAKHDVIIVNFANCDLVGHSGDLKATIKAVEAVDKAVGELYEQAMASGYTMLLTGDHGNADDMKYSDGSDKPAHSMNPVILLIADPENKIKSVKNGGLCQIAPTILELIGLPKPEEMTCESLI